MADDRKSLAESLFRGFRQGGSLGYSDELGAGLQAGLGALTGQGDYGKIYNDALQADRSDDASAREAHPEAYGVSELAGGVVPMLAGARALKAVAPIATPLRNALGTITGGMLAGGGYSTATDPVSSATDAAEGGLESLATLAASHGAGKAVDAAKGRYDQFLRSRPLISPDSAWRYLDDGTKNRYLEYVRDNVRAPYNTEDDILNKARTLAYTEEFNNRRNGGENFHELLGVEKPAPKPDPDAAPASAPVIEELVPNPDTDLTPVVAEPTRVTPGRKKRPGVR